jgi:hypothetical protein
VCIASASFHGFQLTIIFVLFSYKRFTQGKDLSLASSSDMDSILGRRKVKNVGSDLVILEGYN